MKKIGILLICLFLLMTGCSKKEKDISKQATSKETGEETAPAEKTLLADQKPAETEEELLTYIEEVDQQVSVLTTKEATTTNQKSLKNTFITLTDFIFYGGTIKGKTFSSLTDSAKTKVIDLWHSLDEKIEKVQPNYKESIKSTKDKVYTNVKEKASSLKETIINKYKEQVGQEEYENVTQVIEEDKNNLKEAYGPVIDTVKEKSKSAYTNTKDKVSTWYKNWKESSD